MPFRLFSRSSTGRRQAGRSVHNAARRPGFEALEDRRLLSLTPPVGYEVGLAPAALVAADFNNDGTLDLATANNNLGQANISVLLGGAAGEFAPVVDYYPDGDVANSIAVGDFDDDGNLDLATVNGLYHYDWAPYAEGAVSVLFGDGDGGFLPPAYIGVGPGYTKPTSVAAADFDGDGATDLAVSVGVYEYRHIVGVWGEVRVLLSNGDRTFGEPTTNVTMYDSLDHSLVIADFNGDGHQDVAGGSGDWVWHGNTYEPADNVQVALGNGAGQFALRGTYDIELGRSMVVGDLNGDGDADLVAADFNRVYVRLGNGAGGFKPPDSHSFAAGGGPVAIVMGDFDRDGRLDVATANDESHDVSILRGRGDGEFFPAEHFPVRPAPTADFNGDGVVDLGDLDQWRGDVGANADSDADGDGDSDGADFLAWQRQFGASSETGDDEGPYALTAGDFNGDGWLDLATADTLRNSVSVLFNDKTWTPLPTADAFISIDSVTAAEGNGGQTTHFVFTVTLSAAADEEVTTSYRTLMRSARALVNSHFLYENDYVTQVGTLSFAPGETTKTITVVVNADDDAEIDEFFFLDLFDSSSNSRLAVFHGVGTILNDD